MDKNESDNGNGEPRVRGRSLKIMNKNIGLVR